MNKVLLCDANFCVLPIVKTILDKEYNLSVVGSLLSDPAHKIAHTSVNLDYSNVEELYNHIKNTNYNFIVPGCNDKAYVSLSYIAEKLNLIGFDNYKTVLTIHHKDKFKEFAKIKGYPVANSVNNLHEIDKLKLPIIIKPIDSFSGKGTNKVDKIDEIKKYWQEAKYFSKSGAVIAEEFIDGKLYSHSAFIKNGKIIIDFFVNEYCTIYPYQVNSSNIATLLSKKIQDKIKKWLEQFAKDLKLVDGLVHTQFIANDEKFYLIEVARRCPGDLYSELIKKSTGIDYAELYAMPFIGLELPDKIEKIYQKSFARHTLSSDKDCIFINSNVTNLKNKNTQNIQLKNSGEYMKAAPFDKSGIYFIEFDNNEEMESKTESLKDYIKIDTLKVQYG
jgi:biotin carboxylase